MAIKKKSKRLVNKNCAYGRARYDRKFLSITDCEKYSKDELFEIEQKYVHKINLMRKVIDLIKKDITEEKIRLKNHSKSILWDKLLIYNRDLDVLRADKKIIFVSLQMGWYKDSEYKSTLQNHLYRQGKSSMSTKVVPARAAAIGE